MHEHEFRAELVRVATLRSGLRGTLAGTYWYGYWRGLLAWHNLATGWPLQSVQARPLSWAGMEGEPISCWRSNRDVALVAGLADGRLWDQPRRRPGLVRLAHRLSRTNPSGWSGIADGWDTEVVRRWVTRDEEVPTAMRGALESALLFEPG